MQLHCNFLFKCRIYGNKKFHQQQWKVPEFFSLFFKFLFNSQFPIICNACDFFRIIIFSLQESKKISQCRQSCYERFAQLWELVKVNSNTRLWEEEMLNPLTGLGAVKIETECCFLRHQYSTADWTKAAYSGEKKRSVRREKHKKLMLRSFTRLWCGCRAKER